MADKLHYNTVTPLLKEVLADMMAETLFNPFRLVGGTNLSLRFGHRQSDDIDLFTDAPYRSLNFGSFESYLKSRYSFCEWNDDSSIVGFGRSYYVGHSPEQVVKIDLMYTDPFIAQAEIIDGIRMAAVDDIIGMKMDVISRGGRKKDFWDIHYLLDHYTLKQMIYLHEKRYLWAHDRKELMNNFVDFSVADDMDNPVCLLGKDWDIIRIDLAETSGDINK